MALHIGGARAQPGGPPPAKPGVEEGVRWQDLKPAQKAALKPLEPEWKGIDAARKQKWIGISGRYQQMSPDEQARLQGRMNEWAKMTPEQRGAARLHFQEAKQVPASDRQSKWNAYQALPPERKRELAERAAPAPESTARKTPPNRPPERTIARDVPQAKSNIVPNPTSSAQPKPIAPTVVRAGPGATTTSIAKRPTPPSHQQTGLPKIAATPEFVNRSTLLPQRGPQAAGARPVPLAPPSPTPAPPPASR